MHLLLEEFIFLGWWSGYSERGSQDQSDGNNVATYLANFASVFTSLVYGLNKCAHTHMQQMKMEYTVMDKNW